MWLLALLGITYQQLFHERYKALETLFYVIIATLPSVAVLEMVGLGQDVMISISTLYFDIRSKMWGYVNNQIITIS